MQYLGSAQAYPLLAGLQPDLYRCFMQQNLGTCHPQWRRHASSSRISFHRREGRPSSRAHYTVDSVDTGSLSMNYACMRSTTSSRYGVHVYGNVADQVDFLMASSLYHPDTVERSLQARRNRRRTRTQGPRWQHGIYARIANGLSSLPMRHCSTWHAVMERRINSSAPDTDALYREHGGRRRARNPRSPAAMPARLGWSSREDGMKNLRGRKGYFESRWGVPESWDDAILQGPHLYVSHPTVQVSKSDYEEASKTGR